MANVPGNYTTLTYSRSTNGSLLLSRVGCRAKCCLHTYVADAAENTSTVKYEAAICGWKDVQVVGSYLQGLCPDHATIPRYLACQLCRLGSACKGVVTRHVVDRWVSVRKRILDKLW